LRRAEAQHGQAAALRAAELRAELSAHVADVTSRSRISLTENGHIQEEVARFGEYLASLQESVSSARSQRRWLSLLESFLAHTQERIGPNTRVNLELLARTEHTTAFLATCKAQSDNAVRVASQLFAKLYDMRETSAPLVSKTLVKI